MDGEEKYFVSMSEIVTYIGTGARPYKEGERAYNAKHVMYCGVSKSTNDLTEIKALCLQTSSPFDKPHELTVEIKNEKLSSVHCSCKAGVSGTCKHSVAVLMKLNR